MSADSESVAFDEAMVQASHRLFGQRNESQQEKTRLFLEKLVAVAQWGGDVEGFLKNWRLRNLAPHQNSGLLEVIELQHEGQDEAYIVRYITDRYDLDD